MRLDEAHYDHCSTQCNLGSEDAAGILEFLNKIPNNIVYNGKADYDDSYGKAKIDDIHITICFGIVNSEDISKIKCIIKQFGKDKITATLGKISKFECDDYDVLKIDVDSQDLINLNKLIRINLEVESDYPDYNPHLTLCYCLKGTGNEFIGNDFFENREISFDTVLFSEYGIKTSIKLSEIIQRPSIYQKMADLLK